jgi:ubiquinone biosynthesis protein
MRISSLPRIYRNLRRWNEIIAVLRRYGLADWLSHIHVNFLRNWIKDEEGTPLSEFSRATRIRLALMDLGPTFIKLGQILSLRPDLVGSEIATELQLLQTQTTADGFDKVELIVQRELDGPINSHFSEFEPEPIASASIGQTHFAKLPNGTPVVVKVQHHNIRRKVNEDMAILATLAHLAMRLPELAAWQPVQMVQQVSRSLNNELSFDRELRNLQLLQTELQHHQMLKIPKPFRELSSNQILTMERIEGISLQDLIDGRTNVPHNMGKVAEKLANLYIDMVFRVGVYHADPHPGNIRILDDGTIALLDFGMVGRIDERLREIIESMLAAIVSSDTRLLTILIKRAGQVPPTIDDSVLAMDVAEFIGDYGSQPLDSFDLTGALGNVTDIMHRHHIVLPSPAGMLIKTLVTLEGTIRKLNPPFSLLEAVRPAFRDVQLRRYSPIRQAKKLKRMYVEVEDMLEKLPSQVSGIMNLMQRGEMDLRLTHRGLGPSVNRLVLGLLTSSLLLGSSILLAYRVPPLLFTTRTIWGLQDISVVGALGFLASALISFRLLLAINRSGHLNPSHEQEE